jgi:hypothetical protein
MKAILEFNLPEDQSQYNFAMHGSDWWHISWKMDHWLRATIKHAPDSMSEHELYAYEQARKKLHQFISEVNVNLDE